MPPPTLEPLGDQAVLLRWGDVADVGVNRRVHAFATRLRAAAPVWLVDLVPAYASLAVFFDAAAVTGGEPLGVVGEWLEARLAAADAAADDTPPRLVEIPVCYGGEFGPDLDAIAAACGLVEAQVVERHAQGEYVVAMLGFAPGFPYLLGLDPALAVPRLATPRVRVAAGSVGIGGAQTGVYPVDGPGGWQLLGRTPRVLFDAGRERPAVLLPGDRLRFVAVGAGQFQAIADQEGKASGLKALPQTAGASGLKALPQVEVLAGGLQTSVQDLGRFGHRHLGVGVAGALDGYSARVGNLLVGNPETAAVLEIALHGPRLLFRQAVRIALTGADIDASCHGVALPGWRPLDLPAGSELALGTCRHGARAYLAIAGGVRVDAVLGSASTDLRGGFGGLAGRALAAGDALALGPASEPDSALREPAIATWWIDPTPDLDFARDVVVRVLPGRDAVAPAAALCALAWRVTAQSNRQGLRLQGAALTLVVPGERLSEPVAPGTVQLPADGQPILLLAEAQTIGGYPRIGHVVAADLPKLAQLRPGDTLRFAAIDAAGAHALDCAQRARLSRIGLAIGQRRRMDRRSTP